jgi:putative ubiquitin-RnfH superfamily antitoxin RatB of RatAB toxin-antitoxin module
MARLRVEVVSALPGRADRVALELEEGASVRAALAAAGRPEALAVGIHGRRVTLETPLRDGDRVEIYRPLGADPKEARRKRALRPLSRTNR